ncbi:hypothetical protein B5807_08761 [Epicoccum nigrum]|uniref:Uncharacterized protein n=1 Tax=Epicoccum nigrum TaxID=105696 RepID=A0A1Y2LSQ3_EPING|nr:hypothetical protein B5807_08761 [Epicoccum nigrum]
MPSLNAAVFHAYIYGTAFWYGLRGLCRVYDPLMVAAWFRPPSQSKLQANDLELYNIRTDGWCLITLGLILVSLTSAIPSSSSQTNANPSTTPSKAVHSADAPLALQSGETNAILPHAKAVVAATVFHHLTTGLGAWQHYKLASHYNTAMGIGVWGNVWLVVTGGFTLLVAMREGEAGTTAVERKVR